MTTMRPRARLHGFVARRGVAQLMRDLRAAGVPVTRQAVYGWLSGRRTPRAPVVAALVSLSRGSLRVADVVAPVVARVEREGACRSR